MKKVVLAASALLFFGCSQKEEIRYYLPLSKSAEQNSTISVSVESVSYLWGDKIWYKKDGLFLPYKNSYFAKTPKEYLEGELWGMELEGKLRVFLADAYQSYEKDGSSFILSARVELEDANGGKRCRSFRVYRAGFGIGAAEAVRGFEESTTQLLREIKTEFGANR